MIFYIRPLKVNEKYKKTSEYKMTQKITKHMLIGDVVQQYPQTFDVFMKYGLHCVGCHVAAFENIEQGARAHGIEDVDKLISDLNEAISKK